LKLVQQALNHADMKSTLRYAHVTGPEVSDALQLIADRKQNPLKKSLKLQDGGG
jgi:site-specific recombinase XerD